LSVTVVIRNEAENIGRCLLGLPNQSVRPNKMDSGSTDDTLEIADQKSGYISGLETT